MRLTEYYYAGRVELSHDGQTVELPYMRITGTLNHPGARLKGTARTGALTAELRKMLGEEIGVFTTDFVRWTARCTADIDNSAWIINVEGTPNDD